MSKFDLPEQTEPPYFMPLVQKSKNAVIYPRRGKSVSPGLIAKHYKAAKGKEESEFSPNIIIIDELIN